MRYSKLLVPTVKETPADAVEHDLVVAGAGTRFQVERHVRVYLAGDQDVVHAGGATEELDPVVLAAVHLDEAEGRPGAAGAEGEAVQLVVRAELGAGELDPDVLEVAAVAGRVRAAVGAARIRGVDAFDLALEEARRVADVGGARVAVVDAGAAVDRRRAEEGHAGPVARRPRALGVA